MISNLFVHLFPFFDRRGGYRYRDARVSRAVGVSRETIQITRQLIRDLSAIQSAIGNKNAHRDRLH